MQNTKGFYLLLLILSYSVFAQTWTLSACLDYAANHNYSLQKASNQVLANDASLDQARAAQLPTLNGSASNNYNFGRTIDPFTNQFTTSRVRSNNFSVNSSLILFSGLQLRYSIKQNEYEKAASVQDVEEMKRQLYQTVASSFLDVRLQQELLKQAEQQAKLSENAYKQTEQLVKGGVVAESNLSELFAQWKRDELEIVTSQSQVETSILLLKSAMNYPLEDALTIDTSDIQLTQSSISLDSCLQAALKQHPGIQSTQMRVQSAHWAYRSAYARYYPRLTLNANLSTLYSSSAKQVTGYTLTGYRFIGITQTGLDTVLAPSLSPDYENKPFNNQIKDNFNRFIGITLTVPMLNGLQVRKSVTRARLNKQNSELDVLIKQTAIKQDVVRTFAEYKNAEAQLKSSQISREAASNALVQSEKRFASGIGTVYDVTQAKQRLTVSLAEETRARYFLAYRIKLLELYTQGKIN